MDYSRFVWLCCLLCVLVLAIFVPEGSCGRLPSRTSPARRTCAPLKLTNGVVRIRSKGRIGKYLCNEGYRIVGERTATCVRGQWEGTVPLCVKSGCLKMYAPKNGHMMEFYAGAVLSFVCDNGYTLAGSRNIYCDGIAWNSTAPTCQVDNAEPETFCDFESEDLCGWTQDSQHNFDWRRHNFATPSGHVGTGPSYDHTKGKGLDGYYMYIESSSPRMVNDTARLFSPVYPAASSEDGCFVFWYHMFGATTGFLNVYQKPDGLNLSSLKPLFSRSADQGNQWHRGVVRLEQINTPFQIIVEGVRGTSYVSDSAIDDVLLSNGTDCLEPVVDTSQSMPPKIETGGGGEVYDDAQSCRLRCTSNPSFSASPDDDSTLETPVMVTCDCHVGCLDHSTCCPDYSSYCIMAKVTPLPVVPTLEHRTIASVHYFPRSTLPSPPPLPPLPPPPYLPPLPPPSTLPSVSPPPQLTPLPPSPQLPTFPPFSQLTPIPSPPQLPPLPPQLPPLPSSVRPDETSRSFPPWFSRFPPRLPPRLPDHFNPPYNPPPSPNPQTTESTNSYQNTQLFKHQTTVLFENNSAIPTKLPFSEIPPTNLITSIDESYPEISNSHDTNQFLSTTSNNIATENDFLMNTVTDDYATPFDVSISDDDRRTNSFKTSEVTRMALLDLTAGDEVSKTTLHSFITTRKTLNSTFRAIISQGDIQPTRVDEVTVVVEQSQSTQDDSKDKTTVPTKLTTPKKSTTFRKPRTYPTRIPFLPKRTTIPTPTTTEAARKTTKNKMMYYPNSSGEKSKDAETDYLLKKELMDQPKRNSGKLWQQPQQSLQDPSSINASTVIGIVGGVALLFVAFGVVAFAVVRRRRVAGGRSSMSDDSDVRFLTADEMLDFNIARPTEEDDCC